MQALLGAPAAVCGGSGERDGLIGHGKRPARTGLAQRGVRLSVGWLRHRRCHPGNGTARRERAQLNWVSQGQRCGRDWLPAREADAGMAPVADARCPRAVGAKPRAANRPDGRWFSPTPYLRSGWRSDLAAMVSLQLERLLIPVGDEAVVAVAGEQGQLGTGRGLHTGPVHPVGDGRPIRPGYGSMRLRRLLCWRMVLPSPGDYRWRIRAAWPTCRPTEAFSPLSQMVESRSTARRPG